MMFTRFALSLIAALVLLQTDANAQPASRVAFGESWLEIRALGDVELASLASDANTPEPTLTRVILTQAQRNLNRSFPAAKALLKLVDNSRPGSEEAAFIVAMRCQLDMGEGLHHLSTYCEQLDKLATQTSNTLVSAYLRLTQTYFLAREGRHEEAWANAKEAVRLALTSTDPDLIAGANNWVGVQFTIQRLPRLALLRYEIAWAHAQQVPTPESKQAVLFNMAAVYSQLGRHDEAVDIFNKSLNWPIANVSPVQKLMTRSSIGLAMIRAQQPARAEQILLEVIPDVSDETLSSAAIAFYSSLAQAQLAQGKNIVGLANFEKSVSLLDDSQNPRNQATKVHYATALRQSGRTAEARALLEKTIKDLPNTSPNRLLLNALTELAITHDALNNPTRAEQTRAEAAIVQAQLDSITLEHQLARMNDAIEFDRQAQELEWANKRALTMERIATRETTLRYLALALAALVLVAFYLFYSRRMHIKEIQAERTAAEILDLETQMATRMQAEVAQRDLLNKLAEGEKMRALGQLTAGVAHDFNNLMTTVALTAEFLKTDVGDDEQKRVDLLDDILSATNSAASITGELLSYARQQPLQPKAIELDKFIGDSEVIFRNTLGTRHVLETSYIPCKAVVDQGQLASALLNLVLNAKESLGEHGTVNITLTREKKTGSDEEIVVLLVKDSGAGMTTEELDRATEPFFTTKPAGAGTGLGLSMVFGFARQSGGELKIHSQLGKGTTVRLELPLLLADQDEAQTHRVIKNSTLPEGLRALIVEDRESLRDVLKLSLEQLGLTVSTEANADDALDSVTTLGVPDILLSDIKMPGAIDGNQLAHRLKQQYPNLPIIMMSGYSETVEEGCEFLHKPFSTSQLETALLKALPG